MKNISILITCLLTLSTIIFYSCNHEAEILVESEKTNQNVSTSTIESVTFSELVSNFYKQYEDKGQLLATNDSEQASPCDESSDPNITCLAAQDIVLHVDPNGKTYSPMTVPFECGLDIKMTVQFCQHSLTGRITLVVSNLIIAGVESPLSPGCTAWVNQYLTLTSTQQESVVRNIFGDLGREYEIILADNFIRQNPNAFNPCNTDGSCGTSSALTAKYVKGSCTKFCWVNDPEHCGFPIPWCIKEVNCYEDGCCRVDTRYCLDLATDEVVICNGPVLYSTGSCTKLLPNDCLIDPPFPCNTVPRCQL